MSNSSSEPPEKWQRVLAAAKASQKLDDADASKVEQFEPPQEFSRNLLGRLRAFHASLAAWQRWSLLAGIASVLIFVASMVYLKVTAKEPAKPLIQTPGIELPQPSNPDGNTTP